MTFEPERARRMVHFLSEQGKTPEQIALMLRWSVEAVQAELADETDEKNDDPDQEASSVAPRAIDT